MTPEQMIQQLSRHFSIRFDSEEDQTAWLRDVVEAFRGYDKRVLADATRWIISNRKMRGFPLISEIKEACGKTPTYETAQPAKFQGPSRRAPDSAEEIEAVRKAREWQKQICDEYGTMDNYLKRTVARRVGRFDVAPAKPLAKRETEVRSVGEALPINVNRDTFERMQRDSSNEQHRLTNVSRRMTGDRE